MGLSVSILVFESELSNRRDMEIGEGCQFSLTIFIQNILQLVGIGNMSGSCSPKACDWTFPFSSKRNFSGRRTYTKPALIL